MKRSLKRFAYSEAAALLAADMDAADLSACLSEKEEDEVREFIRTKICKELFKKSVRPVRV